VRQVRPNRRLALIVATPAHDRAVDLKRQVVESAGSDASDTGEAAGTALWLYSFWPQVMTVPFDRRANLRAHAHVHCGLRWPRLPCYERLGASRRRVPESHR